MSNNRTLDLDSSRSFIVPLCQHTCRPVLLETFVEKPRFAGTCYKAANWTYLGQTKGRGKLGVSGKQSVPIKDLWVCLTVCPLNTSFRAALTG